MLIVCLILKQVATILELQIPSALADIIDKAVPMAKESGDTSTIIRYGVYMILFAIAGAGKRADLPSAAIRSGTVTPRRTFISPSAGTGKHCSCTWSGPQTLTSTGSRLRRTTDS